MILTLSKVGRRFVGRFDLGDDLLERLNAVAEQNHVRTAVFSCSGYLREPEITRYRPADKAIGAKTCHEGDWFVSTLKGTISLRGSQREISAQAHLLHDDGRSLHGFLTGGAVVFLDVVIDTLEDIVLTRDVDPAVGVSQWMGVLLPEMLDDAGLPPSPDAPTPAASRVGGRRVSSLPSFLLEDEEIPEVFKGDFLDHPSLGKCKVVNIHEDDRVTVMLPEQGKLAEINLEFFTYRIIRKEGGRQYIRLDVKRR